MPVVVVDPPEPLIGLAEAKRFLQVDSNDDDALIPGLVAAATAYFDGPSGYLGRVIGEQTLELTSHGFPRCVGHPFAIHLPYPPLISVTSIAYIDAAGAEQELVEDTDFTIGVGGNLWPIYGGSWPSARFQQGAVKVTYIAGSTGGELEQLKTAVLLKLKSLYDGEAPDGPYSTSAANLAAPLRIWSV